MATDGTQYLIDLQAKFTGGDAAVSTLANLGDRMLAAGAKVVDFEAATRAATSALETAAEAAKVAGDALSVGQAKYGEAEVAADRAAKAVERFGEKAQEQAGKLQAALDTGDAKKIEAAEAKAWKFIVAQHEATTAAESATAALAKEAEALDVLKSAASSATAKQTDLKKGIGNLKDASEKATKLEGTGKVNEMAEAFGKLGGPAGVAGQKVLGMASGFSKLGKAMGTAGPYVAVAVAIVAIASAAFLAAVAITKWGVGMADANRTQSALAAGIARSTKGGEELQDEIAKINAVVPLTTEELTGMAKGLADGGLRGKDLTAALERSAVAAAKLKFGPDFQKQLLSLDFQSKRFGDNLASVFGGLKIDPLLEGVQTLIALFDTSEASGKALQFLFESLFQPLVDGTTAVIPKIERMFLYAEILALKAYIALKPYRSEIAAVGQALLVGAAIIAGIFAASIALVIGLIGGLAFIAADLVATIYKWVAAFVAVEQAIFGGLADAVAFVADLGSKMIDGLVKGITGGATAVYNAMAGVVTGAIDGAKKLLGIASPSAVFADIGDNTAAGFAKGVDSGADTAQSSLEAMVAPPDVAAKGGAGAGGGVTLNIAAINVNGQNAKEQALDFVDQITQLLENLGVTVGGGEAPAHA